MKIVRMALSLGLILGLAQTMIAIDPNIQEAVDVLKKVWEQADKDISKEFEKYKNEYPSQAQFEEALKKILHRENEQRKAWLEKNIPFCEKLLKEVKFDNPASAAKYCMCKKYQQDATMRFYKFRIKQLKASLRAFGSTLWKITKWGTVAFAGLAALGYVIDSVNSK